MEKPQHTKKEGVGKEAGVEDPKELIEFLNKARQGNVEHEDVYWHVFGKGSKTDAKYPASLINRPDLLEKFAVGKGSEFEYHNTTAAAHDLIEYLAKEAEGRIKDNEKEKRQKTITNEIETQKNLLDLLNKAGQGNVEHEDVYWHVFGKGSKTDAKYPASLINRPDLLEKFAVGKNGEPYRSTRDAAHDLMEYLANEAEGKIRNLTKTPEPGPKKEKEKVKEETKEKEDEKTPENKSELIIIFLSLLEKAKSGDETAVKILIEFIVTHKIEITIVGLEPTPEEIEAQRTLIILLEKVQGGDITVITELITFISIHVITITIITPEPTPPTPEKVSSLDDLRDAYLKAKRLRGNIFRGGFGRFFKRKLNFGTEEMDFGGKEGKSDLEIVRKEYQEKLAQYRSAELATIEGNLSGRLSRGEITPAEANAEMQGKIVGLLSEEQGNIDNKSVTGIERNLLEKMKTKWRQFGKTRLIAGALLGGAALTGVAVPAVIGARAGMGAVGTYVGVEAGLERYSKLVGHKGLIKEINKVVGNSITGRDLRINNYLSGLPPLDIKKEAARLRMLQVEKGVSIDNLNTLGDNGEIAALIIKRDDELTAQETMGTAHLDPALVFADRLSNRLAMEINLRNEVVEREVDRERIKKMFRKTTAVLAGGTVGWLIGGKLFQGQEVAPPTPPSAPHLPVSSGIEPIPVPPDTFHTVTTGENTWKIIESNLDSHNTMAGLGEGARTHMIDALKDRFDNMTPAELKGLGFTSGDADLLHIGDSLNMSGILDNHQMITETLLKAQNVSPTDLVEIVKNNREIASWLAEHRQELTGVFDSTKIAEVLRAAGR